MRRRGRSGRRRFRGGSRSIEGRGHGREGLWEGGGGWSAACPTLPPDLGGSRDLAPPTVETVGLALWNTVWGGHVNYLKSIK